jgi:hypothetical protein
MAPLRRLIEEDEIVLATQILYRCDFANLPKMALKGAGYYGVFIR